MEVLCDDGIAIHDKSMAKRRVTREHNSNFRAGHVQVHEEQLHKTGVRGRKAALVYTITALLFLLALSNAVIIWLILGSLHMSLDGLRSMEFIPSINLLRFKQDVEIERLVSLNNQIGGLHNESLVLEAENDQEILVHLGATEKARASISVSSESITFASREDVTITDPDSGRQIFSSDFESEESRFPENVRHLNAQKITTQRVTSGLNERLALTSKNSAQLKAENEIKVDSRSVKIAAKHDLNLSAVGSVILSSSQGIFLDQSSSLPVSSSPLFPTVESYKLCICLSSGNLFTVPGDRSCLQTDGDPCI